MGTGERKDYGALVSGPFQVFSGIFLTLPLDGIRSTGLRVPELAAACTAGLDAGLTPPEVLEAFFARERIEDVQEQADLLFRIIQYIERQVVLVDALEDARYTELNDVQGPASFAALLVRARKSRSEEEVRRFVSGMGIRVVLTAHPAQAYPGSALDIVADVSRALDRDDLSEVRRFLHQLGLTPLVRSGTLSPLEEAERQAWYLEHVFYPAVPDLMLRIGLALDDPGAVTLPDDLFQVGFWPGGDREGAPEVGVETTLAVADMLQKTLLRCYRSEFVRLRRRISFKGSADLLAAVEARLNAPRFDAERLASTLFRLEEAVAGPGHGLYLDRVRRFRAAVRLFGRHFASLDIRQDAEVALRAHHLSVSGIPLEAWTPETRDVVEVLRGMAVVHKRNGVRGCHRFVLSHCTGPEAVWALWDVARTFAEETVAGLDVVPVFESWESLLAAGETLKALLSHAAYRSHVVARGGQTVMLGFADGTFDAGYLAANWAIYRAKRDMTAEARRHGIEVIFFDGRGGPPARGGVNTHRYYAALGPEISHRAIQTNLQGQTISSNFGVPESAAFNLEAMLTAGASCSLLAASAGEEEREAERVLESMAERSREVFLALLAMPGCGAYLKAFGAAEFLEGSVHGLRGIAFTGAWSLARTHVPGFFGLGTALEELIASEGLATATRLYTHHALFRTLVDNSMQSMAKCDFRLTLHAEHDPRFAAIRATLQEEFHRTERNVLAISGQQRLLEHSPLLRDSIALRNAIILPLLVILQASLARLREADGASETADLHRRLAARSMFGIVNASRNAG